MKKTVIYAGSFCLLFTACIPQENAKNENREVVIRESDLKIEQRQVVADMDSLQHGPFYKYAVSRKVDDNGGYEEYRLIMNLYEPNIPGEDGLTHGRLSLYVKTPENTEGVKVAQRTIQRVERIDGLRAEIEMAGIGEKPVCFDGVITYDTVTYTYKLDMNAPAQLEDLMGNHLVLQ